MKPILNEYFIMLFQADFLRSIGKIYVVAIVSLIVWFGVAWYLLRLERKLKDVENQIKSFKS
ncbi:MAG: CcmD family protein [Saprospiraceae bacterium]